MVERPSALSDELSVLRRGLGWFSGMCVDETRKHRKTSVFNRSTLHCKKSGWATAMKGAEGSS